MTVTSRRVVHVLNSTAVGGAETLVLRLGVRLQELGWGSEVVTLRGEGPLSEAFRAAGIAVTDLAVPPDGGVWAMQRAMRRWLATTRPNVLHTHNVSPLVAVALATGRRDEIRFIHTKHGRARAGTWPGRLLTWWAARKPDTIVAVSRDALERAIARERFPPERVTLVYNGIDTASITPRQGPWQKRLVTVARLEPVKSLGDLIRATAIARQRGIAVDLTVVGDGSERPSLEALARDLGVATHVTFTGWRSDVQAHLREADLFVMSSRSEGLSLTLLEAMATGLPVVATAVGGNPELVEHGTTGVLVPHGEPDAMATAIGDILADPDLATRMGRAGRDQVLARFSLDQMADSYARLYEGR